MKKKMKRSKKLVIALSIIAILICALLIGAGNFLVGFAIDTQSSFNMKTLFTMAAEKQQQTGEAEDIDYSGFGGTQEEIKWFAEETEDIYVTSEDGLKLHAYLIINEEENSNGNFVMVFHGYTSQGKDMAYSAKHFYDMGYSILLPDARSHGTSEGRYISMGWPERKDNLLWINEIIKINENAKIALYGISMGGATVINTAGEDLSEQVTVAIEDCGYSSVWDEFSHQMKSMFRLPSFPLLNIAAIIAEIKAGFDFTEADSTKQAAKIKIPTLFIHGSNDTFVPFEMLDKLYEAATCEKEKLVVEGAGHAMSAADAPELYWNTVETFLEKHIEE